MNMMHSMSRLAQSGLEPATGSEIMLLVLGGILTLVVGVGLIVFFITKQMRDE